MRDFSLARRAGPVILRSCLSASAPPKNCTKGLMYLNRHTGVELEQSHMDSVPLFLKPHTYDNNENP